MRIQMNDRDRSVNRLQRPQDWQHDRMVSAQTDDPRMLPRAFLRSWMIQDLSITLLHLFECMGSIEGRDGDISAVDLSPCQNSILTQHVSLQKLCSQFQGLLHRDPHPIRGCSCGPSFPARSLPGFLGVQIVLRGDRKLRCRRESPGEQYRGALRGVRNLNMTDARRIVVAHLIVRCGKASLPFQVCKGHRLRERKINIKVWIPSLVSGIPRLIVFYLTYPQSDEYTQGRH